MVGLDSTLPDEPPRRAPLRAMGARGGRQRCPTCGQDFPPSYRVCPRDATPLGVASDADPLIGAVLAGTYRLTRTIGRGGMGRLYEAEHARLDRRFAVKVLHESHADKPEAVRRFEREADALARIRSDFVLDVVDVLRTPDSRTAIVTALLEGEDLQRRLDRQKVLPSADAIALARAICRGMAAAHAASVVHRDLKPSNVYLVAAADGRPSIKILDFGVAKLAGDDEMTRTGVVLGTPAYMAPEQARGSSAADPRSDVYAIGAVLYRMLTGRLPYEGTDPGATLAMLLAGPPPRPRTVRADVPVALEVVIQRAMARDPGERPGSALELEAMLAALDRDAGPREARPAEDPDTLVLAHGTVERAESLERGARRARPMAALAALGSIAAIGAASAGALAALSSLVASPMSSMVGTGEAQGALSRALAIVGGIAASLAAAAAISRWLRPRWSSAPAVTHATRRIVRALAAGLASMGVALLGATGFAATMGVTVAPTPGAVVLVVACAAIASTIAASRVSP